MGKYNFCEELKRKLGLIELDSKTLSYRINGFLYACNMDLENGNIGGTIDNGKIICSIKKNEDGVFEVMINVIEGDHFNHERELVLKGNYNNINFLFSNKYDKNTMKNKILEIPFNINLKKDKYILTVNSVFEERVEFYLEEVNDNYSRHIHFYANISNFEDILRLVATFVNNPKEVFDNYNNIMEAKKIVFTNTDVKKGLIFDKELEKPVNKLVKKLKCE